ncbi:UNVERIFIED_CONTAM: hypothetical protein FKN15_036246 [Acipenser sinensis]
MLVENLKKKTLIALCTVQDALVGNSRYDTITKALVKHVKAARMQYVQFLEDEKKVESENNWKRKEIATEIENVKQKQKVLHSIEIMQKEADEMAERAEKKEDFTVLSKSNAY